jgi:hypothetical protein
VASRHLRQQQQRNAIRRQILAAAQANPFVRGIIRTVNANGTVGVNLQGDTTVITAEVLAPYDPKVGDKVEVRKEGGFRVVHGAYTRK